MRPKSPYETVIETTPEGATAIAVAAEVSGSDQLNTGVLVQMPPASVAWRSSVVDPLVPRYAAWIWSDPSMAMDAPLPAASIVVTDQPPAELVQYRIERSEERRVGKECRSRGGPARLKSMMEWRDRSVCGRS